MNMRTCFQKIYVVASRLAPLMAMMLLAAACQPAPTTFRPPNQDELHAFSTDQSITPIADELLDDSSVLLYEDSTSFGYYILTVQESDGTVVASHHGSAAKSDQPILVMGQLTGEQPLLAVVIQDETFLAETTAIEVLIDAENRLTATTGGRAGAILVSPSPVDGWRAVTLYNAQGETLYRQESD